MYREIIDENSENQPETEVVDVEDLIADLEQAFAGL